MTIRREQTDWAPNACPDCGEAAYIGMSEVQCTNFKCRNFHEDTWAKHVMALPDEGDPLPDDVADEPTHPGFSLLNPELLKLREEIQKAIDTVPSPCYTVNNGSKQRR